jgi:hypothetical protein
MTIRIFAGAAVAALALLVTGCGGKGDSGGGASGGGGTPSGKEALTSLADLLKDFAARNAKPPARIADVEAVEPVFPGAYIGLKRDDIVYYWGNGINAGNGGTVIAHEKTADSGGGWVLMQNGDVKQMSADEFKAAPKATKK